MAIFNCYVSSPEGTNISNRQEQGSINGLWFGISRSWMIHHINPGWIIHGLWKFGGYSPQKVMIWIGVCQKIQGWHDWVIEPQKQIVTTQPTGFGSHWWPSDFAGHFALALNWPLGFPGHPYLWPLMMPCKLLHEGGIQKATANLGRKSHGLITGSWIVIIPSLGSIIMYTLW